MKLLIIGCGQAGLEVAKQAKAKGWEVIGTTTSDRRVAEIEAVADKAVILRGSDTDKVKAAAEGVDAVLVSVSPPAVQSATVEQRKKLYQEVLEESGKSAAAAAERVVFMSSISVYGDGKQEPGDKLTETTPRATDNGEPSTTYFAAGEDPILALPKGSVMRLPDIYQHPSDFGDRVKLAHEYMNHSVPFDEADRYHPINVVDVARAAIHILENDLYGAYNVVPDEEPAPTVGEFWHKVADKTGQDRLEFRGEIRTPIQPASSEKFRATGFTFQHPISEIL